MKKLLYCLSVFLLFAVTASAQSAKQMENMKMRMQKELDIDAGKADSVLNVVKDFFTSARSIRTSPTLKDEEKKTALKKSRQEEMARLKAFLNNEQMQKLQTIVQEYRQEKQTRKAGKDSTYTDTTDSN